MTQLTKFQEALQANERDHTLKDSIIQACLTYIRLSPCDPDITADQWLAYKNLCDELKKGDAAGVLTFPNEMYCPKQVPPSSPK